MKTTPGVLLAAAGLIGAFVVFLGGQGEVRPSIPVSRIGYGDYRHYDKIQDLLQLIDPDRLALAADVDEKGVLRGTTYSTVMDAYHARLNQVQKDMSSYALFDKVPRSELLDHLIQFFFSAEVKSLPQTQGDKQTLFVTLDGSLWIVVMKGALIDLHAVVAKVCAVFLEDPERKEEPFRLALTHILNLFYSGFFVSKHKHPVWTADGYKLINDTFAMDMDYADFRSWYYNQVDQSQDSKIILMIDALANEIKDRILDTEAHAHEHGKELVFGSEFTTQYMAIEGAWYDKNTTFPVFNLDENKTNLWQNVSEEALSQNVTKMDLPMNAPLNDDDEFDGDAEEIVLEDAPKEGL